MHVNDGKLEPRAKKCIFLGYTSGVKGFRLWDPVASKFLTSRDVTFNESVFLQPEKSSQDNLQMPEETSQGSGTSKEVEFDASDSHPATTPEVEDIEQQVEPQVEPEGLARGRVRRQIRPPVRFGYEEMAAYALVTADTVDVHESLSSGKR